MGNLKERKVTNKKRVAVFLSLCMTMVMLVGTLTAFAGIGGPISSIVSITPDSDFFAGSPELIEQSQSVEIVVDLNTTVTAPFLDKDDFLVNITGAPGGGWIDGVTNQAMDFDVELVDNNTLRFIIFATADAEVPNGPPDTATNDFFAMRTKLVTITAASGTTIPSIIDNSTSSALSWPSNSFSNIAVDTGARGFAHNSVAGNVSANIAPSIEFTFTQVAVVRGMVSVAGTSSEDGYIQFSTTVPAPLNYAAPIHAHNFYNMSLATYATTLVTYINSPAGPSGYSATLEGTATVRVTKTGSYVDGETLNLYILDYTNQ